MKFSTILSALMITTALTACGGGGGGGHYVPQTTLPNIPNTASAEITSMTNDGLSNSEKRLENFQSAQQQASSTMFRLRRAAPRVANQDDVDGAYQKMYDLLIDDLIDANTTNQELLMALLLAGFDMEEFAGKDLRKFKDETGHRIKKDAHRMWKMYGKEKDVYLDNAGMTLVGSESAQNTKFNFVMNDKNDVADIELAIKITHKDDKKLKINILTNNLFFSQTKSYIKESANGKTFVLNKIKMPKESEEPTKEHLKNIVFLTTNSMDAGTEYSIYVED